MHQSTATSAPVKSAGINGTCRWMCDDPRGLLLAGMAAPLRIWPDSQVAPDYYYVSPERRAGETTGWRITKQAPDGAWLNTYVLPCSLLECSCRARVRCRHRKALRAALMALDLIF